MERCEREHLIKSSSGPLTHRTRGGVKTEGSIKSRARQGENNSTHDIMIRGTRLMNQSHAVLRHMYSLLLGVG